MSDVISKWPPYLRRNVEFSEKIVERFNEFVDRKSSRQFGKLADVGEQHTDVLVTFDEKFAKSEYSQLNLS